VVRVSIAGGSFSTLLYKMEAIDLFINGLIQHIFVMVNEQLHIVASYFWEKLTLESKQDWKAAALAESKEKNLTGKRRVRGFWLFAINLRNALYEQDAGFFRHIWKHMALEHQERLQNNLMLMHDDLEFLLFFSNLIQHW